MFNKIIISIGIGALLIILSYLLKGDALDYLFTLTVIYFNSIFFILIHLLIIIPFFYWVLHVPQNKTYTIKKGRHRSGYRVKLFFNNKITNIKVWLHNWDFYFVSNQDLTQENKVFGMNFGFPKIVKEDGKWKFIHPNSIRITTCRQTSSKSNRYSYYCRYKGKKLPNKIIGYTYQHGSYGFDAEIGRDVLEKIVMRSGVPFTGLPKFGYYLFPYIGGVNKAVRTLKLTIRYFTKKVAKNFLV